MRKFVYVMKSTKAIYSSFTEEQILKNSEGPTYSKDVYDLFELVPRTIKTVTKQEII